jgi:hypothetical protein
MTEERTEYAIVKAVPATVQTVGWQELKEIATIFHKSGLIPAHLKSPEQVIAACVVARDLGLPLSVVLQGGLYVVNGTVSTDSKTMMALIMRARGEISVSIRKDDKAGWVECTMERPSVGLSYTARWDEARVQESKVNIDPKSKGEKWPWKLHRQTMKTWRAIAEAARVVAPDIIGGLYLADELDVPTSVVNGEMVIEAEMDETEPLPFADEPANGNGELPAAIRNMNDFYKAAVAKFNYPDKQAVVDALSKFYGSTVLEAQRDGATMGDLWGVLLDLKEAEQQPLAA